MDKKILIEFGLSEGEVEVYLALIKIGESTVTELAKETGKHRTHIYDTLEKLKGKGLVSSSINNNRSIFMAADPENFRDLLREREEKLDEIIPQLKSLRKIPEKEILVETYKGSSGIKTVLRDILRENKDYLCYGEGIRFQKIVPHFFEYYMAKADKLNIKSKIILKKGAEPPIRKKAEIKFISKEFTPPATTFIYNSKVVVIIWEPTLSAILITSKQVSDSYRKYFDILWKIAKK